MSNILTIHPETPQARLIEQAANGIRAGKLVLYPTDACYALGCQMDCVAAVARIRQIRHLDESHKLTLICPDMSTLSHYAEISNHAFRLLKAHTPGPYTFILRGSSALSRRLEDPKRKTIGVRIPAHPILQALLAALDLPLLSTTAIWPEAEILTSPDMIYERFQKVIDIFIDGGPGAHIPTTVVDLMEDKPRVLRVGAGIRHLLRDVRVFLYAVQTRILWIS